MYCTEKATGTGPDVRSLAPGHNSETKPGLSATSWLPISSIGNSTSGIHIKRSLVSVGHFCLNQLHVHQSTYNLGSSISHLTTGSSSAGPTAWPLALSEDPPWRISRHTFYLLWMWHSSRRAGDPLLGLDTEVPGKASSLLGRSYQCRGQVKYGESHEYLQFTWHMQRLSRKAGSRDKVETCTSEPPDVDLFNYQEQK